MLQDLLSATPQPPDAATAAENLPDVHEELSNLSTMSFDELMNQLVSSSVKFAINLAIAILVFYLGKFIITRLYRFIGSILLRRRVDPSLTTFILSTLKIILYFILIVTVIGILGIETSSFLALFASAGVAIGMALSGTLQNFAGGVLILLLKPYKVGDYIEAQGYAGTVNEIQIFHTLISTPDNKAIIIPNGGLSTSSINNWSRRDYRRVSWSVGISYGDSVASARKAILAMFEQDERIIKGKAAKPFITRRRHRRKTCIRRYDHGRRPRQETGHRACPQARVLLPAISQQEQSARCCRPLESFP